MTNCKRGNYFLTSPSVMIASHEVLFWYFSVHALWCAWGNFFASPSWSTRTMTECRARSTSLWAHSSTFWQLSKEGSFRFAHHESVSKTILQETLGGWAMLWSVEGMLDGQCQRVDTPCPRQNYSQQLPTWKKVTAVSSVMSFWQPKRSMDFDATV